MPCEVVEKTRISESRLKVLVGASRGLSGPSKPEAGLDRRLSSRQRACPNRFHWARRDLYQPRSSLWSLEEGP